MQTQFTHPADTLFGQRWPDMRHLFQNERPRWFDMVAASALAHRYAGGLTGRAYAVPNDPNIDIAANGTFEGRLTLPDQSYIYAIQGDCSEAAGFEFSVRDYTTGEELWSRRMGAGVAAGNATGMGFLPRPHLVLSPGILLVQILNRAAAQNTIQLVFLCAVPAQAR